jgi:hypothetical protein
MKEESLTPVAASRSKAHRGGVHTLEFVGGHFSRWPDGWNQPLSPIVSEIPDNLIWAAPEDWKWGRAITEGMLRWAGIQKKHALWGPPFALALADYIAAGRLMRVLLDDIEVARRLGPLRASVNRALGELTPEQQAKLEAATAAGVYRARICIPVTDWLCVQLAPLTPRGRENADLVDLLAWRLHEALKDGGFRPQRTGDGPDVLVARALRAASSAPGRRGGAPLDAQAIDRFLVGMSVERTGLAHVRKRVGAFARALAREQRKRIDWMRERRATERAAGPLVAISSLVSFDAVLVGNIF